MTFPGFNISPTEQTTAFTDLILMIQCLWMARMIWKRGADDPVRRNLWSAMLLLVAIASGIGAFAHGVNISRATDWVLFRGIYLVLGFSVGLFVCGLIFDVSPLARRHQATNLALCVMTALALLFFALTVIFPAGFKAFLLYQAVAVLSAMAGYGYLSIRKKFPGARWIISALLLNTGGALIQATRKLHWTFIWEFDFNGTYHFLQMLAFAALYIGIVSGFPPVERSRERANTPSSGAVE